MVVNARAFPPVQFAATNLHNWMKYSTVRETFVAQENNTISPARALLRAARFGGERNDHEVDMVRDNTIAKN